MILLFGVGKSVLKQFYADNCNCSNCKQTLQHRFTVYGHYFSFFFVPVIPLFKTTTSECVHCRSEISKDSWNTNLTERFNKVIAAQPPKRPWWHFIGCFGVLLVVLFFSVLLGYAYYTVKDDPEIQQLTNDIKQMKLEEEEEYNYEDADSSSVVETEPLEAQEPIDSIISFFKK